MKKISETKKKTKQILDLKKANDAKFQKQIKDQANNNGSMKQTQSNNYEKRKDLN